LYRKGAGPCETARSQTTLDPSMASQTVTRLASSLKSWSTVVKAASSQASQLPQQQAEQQHAVTRVIPQKITTVIRSAQYGKRLETIVVPHVQNALYFWQKVCAL